MKWYGRPRPWGAQTATARARRWCHERLAWAAMASVPARVNRSPRERADEPFDAVPSPHRDADAARDGQLGAFARLFGD